MARPLARHVIVLVAAAAAFRATPARAQSQQGGAADWSGYDFTPGSDLLFFEDFTGPAATALAHFARHSARLDVAARGDQRFLHARPPATVEVMLPRQLGDRYTVDFDAFIPGDNRVILHLPAVPGQTPVAVECGPHQAAIGNGGASDSVGSLDARPDQPNLEEVVIHCAIAVDGANIRAYVNQMRAVDATIPSGRSNRLTIEFPGGDDPTLIDGNIPIWISNLRIAAGGPELSWERLAATGRLALRGILFDTNSDRIRAESTPVLNQLAALLREHADVALTIEGHTDNVGNDAANQALSEHRAAAVKAWLVAAGIADARLDVAGFGASRPTAPNTTAAGRQQNRRVELVRR